MIAWLFDSPRRLQSVAAGLAVTAVVLTIVLLAASASTRTAAPASTPGPSAVQHTELIPPTSPEPTASPTRYVPPSQPVALEAVSAWLRYDLDDFGVVASPAALEAVSDSPRPVPGQEILDSRVELGGPNRQTVQVDVTGGTLELVMVTDDDRWLVDTMRYVK